MHKVLRYTGLVLVFLACWSCEDDVILHETAESFFENERIDFVLESDTELKVNSLGDNDLIDITYNHPFWFYDNERLARIDLGAGAYLKLIVRNAGHTDPFQAGKRYSAYPFNLMEDRNTYVIAQYINKGILQYATTRAEGSSLIQTNVLEIGRVLENGFSARINDLTLNKVEVSDDGRAFSGEVLSVNGTFIAIFD